MAKFFVGQRVVLARPINPADKGMMGTIKELLTPDLRMITNGGHARLDSVDCTIDWDTHSDCWQHTSQLEPVTDRNEVVTWESCAWSPHGVSA